MGNSLTKMTHLRKETSDLSLTFSSSCSLVRSFKLTTSCSSFRFSL